MSDRKKLSGRSQAWPPANAFEYVRSDEFAELISNAALAHHALPEAVAVIFDLFDRRARADHNLFQSFPTRGHLRRYLTKALFRAAVRLERRLGRKLAQAAELVARVPAKDISPHRRAELDEFVAAAHKALLSLKPDERRVVSLRFFASQSNRKTARELGLSESRASRLYHTGLARLADMLAEFNDR